jgi:hypothetical protein
MDRSKNIIPHVVEPLDPDPDHQEDGLPATLYSDGLLFTYPGIRLESVSPRFGTKFTTVIPDEKIGFRIWLPKDETVHWDRNLQYAVVLFPYFRHASPGEATAALLGLLLEEDEPGILRLQHVSRLWVLRLRQESEEFKLATRELSASGEAEKLGKTDNPSVIGIWLDDEQQWVVG